MRTGWLKFLSYCVLHWQEANSPLGIHISQNTHLIMLVKPDMLSLIRTCDSAEVLHHFQERHLDSSLFSLLPTSSLGSHPTLVPSPTRDALLAFMGVVDAIHESLMPTAHALVLMNLSRELVWSTFQLP